MNTAAQKRSRIFGTVRDDRGDPIELANVRIQAQGVRTVTNLKGEYSLYCSSRDTVVVIYSLIGYETRRRKLNSPSDSVRIDICHLTDRPC